MLKLTKKEKKGKAIAIALSGTFDEEADLNQLIGPPPPELWVDCREINRFNSVGVRAWVSYFIAARQAGTRLTFSHCSPSVVDQLNQVRGFADRREVESVLAVFRCPKCRDEFKVTFGANELLQYRGTVEDRPCPKCGESSEFDDLPEAYFNFLKSD